jgi:WhiB family redox-sensing transcriptional regulator
VALTWAEAEGREPAAWRSAAACRRADPELFFPVGSARLAADHLAAAKAVCRTCPVRVPCLEFAMATNQDAGVWGGTSEEERRVLRAARRRP